MSAPWARRLSSLALSTAIVAGCGTPASQSVPTLAPAPTTSTPPASTAPSPSTTPAPTDAPDAWLLDAIPDLAIVVGATLPGIRYAGDSDEARSFAKDIASLNAGANGVVQVYVDLTAAPGQPKQRDFIVVADMWVIFGSAALAEWRAKTPDQHTAFVVNLLNAARYYPAATSMVVVSDGSLHVLATGTYLRQSGQKAVHLHG